MDALQKKVQDVVEGQIVSRTELVQGYYSIMDTNGGRTFKVKD